MDHTNAVYQFVSPRIKFPTKPLSFCRAFGALHGSHSVSFLPLSPSTERQEAAVNGLRCSTASSFLLADCNRSERYRHQLSCYVVLISLLSVLCFVER